MTVSLLPHVILQEPWILYTLLTVAVLIVAMSLWACVQFVPSSTTVNPPLVHAAASQLRVGMLAVGGSGMPVWFERRWPVTVPPVLVPLAVASCATVLVLPNAMFPCDEMASWPMLVELLVVRFSLA